MNQSIVPASSFKDSPSSSPKLFLTMRPGRLSGIKMRADLYQMIKSEMVALIVENERMTLQSFIDILHAQLVGQLGEQTGWYLIQVKIDLETRKVIRVERCPNNRNLRTIIRLTGGAKKERARLTVL